MLVNFFSVVSLFSCQYLLYEAVFIVFNWKKKSCGIIGSTCDISFIGKTVFKKRLS